MKGETRAVAGTKFARQVASQNGKIHTVHKQSPEIEAWNARIKVEKEAKKREKDRKKILKMSTLDHILDFM